MVIATVKRPYSQKDLKVSNREYLIDFMNGYKYIGVTLDPSLNMNYHVQKPMKNVAALVKILKSIRHSLYDLTVELVYKAMAMPKRLQC